MKRRMFKLISLILLSAIALTACGTGSGPKVIQADIDAELAGTTTTTQVETESSAPVADEDGPGDAAPVATATPLPEAPVAETQPQPAAETQADTLITVASGPLTVLESPGGAVLVELPATTQFGSPTTLSVLELGDEYVQVGGLPIRPNGAVGWMARADADLRRVSYRVEVDLEARQLAVYADDDLYLESAVAVGAPENPTPTGHLFVVTDVLDTGDPNSPYGRFALGLSGLSDSLTEFAGGPGQIGIHGTSDPSSIGQAVSHGCVRVPADVAEQLAAILPLGTPVIIR